MVRDMMQNIYFHLIFVTKTEEFRVELFVSDHISFTSYKQRVQKYHISHRQLFTVRYKFSR